MIYKHENYSIELDLCFHVYDYAHEKLWFSHSWRRYIFMFFKQCRNFYFINPVFIRNCSMCCLYSVLWALKWPTWGDLSHLLTIKLLDFDWRTGITSVSRCLQSIKYFLLLPPKQRQWLTCKVCRSQSCCRGRAREDDSWGPGPSTQSTHCPWCWSLSPLLSVSSGSSSRPGDRSHQSWTSPPPPCSCHLSSATTSWWCREPSLWVWSPDVNNIVKTTFHHCHHTFGLGPGQLSQTIPWG